MFHLSSSLHLHSTLLLHLLLLVATAQHFTWLMYFNFLFSNGFSVEGISLYSLELWNFFIYIPAGFLAADEISFIRGAAGPHWLGLCKTGFKHSCTKYTWVQIHMSDHHFPLSPTFTTTIQKFQLCRFLIHSCVSNFDWKVRSPLNHILQMWYTTSMVYPLNNYRETVPLKLGYIQNKTTMAILSITVLSTK